MKFYISFSYIFLVLFLINSCNESSVSHKSRVGQSKKINEYLNKVKKNKRDSLIAFKYLDSALVLSKLSKNDSLELKSLDYKTKLFSRYKKYHMAMVYADTLLQKATYFKDTSYIAKSYLKKGKYNMNLNNYVNAFKNYGLSKTYYQKLKDSNQVANILNRMSRIQIDVGDYVAAKDLILEGLNFQKNESTNKYISNLYDNLSIIKKEEKQFDKSLEYKEKSIQLLKNKSQNSNYRDSLNLLKLENNKAVIYIKKGDFQAASVLLKKNITFPLLKLEGNIKLYATILDNLGVANAKLGNEEAEKTLMLAYKIRDSIDNKIGLNASLIHLCEFYIDNKKPYEALPWAKKAYLNAVLIESLIAQKEALNYIIELESAPQKKYITAYKKISDSLTTLSNQVRDIYAEQKYEANEYKMLALKRKEETTKERSYKLIVFTIGFMLILVIVVYYYLSDKVKTEKYKKNQLQTVYDTETRISKKVHDELANDVYSLMSKVQLDSSMIHKSEIINSLEVIYNKSRDISRETNEIDTNNFKETLQELILNYSNTDTNVISKGLSDEFWIAIPESKKIVVFRVLQELLINMKKHSQASFVILNFSKISSEIQIMYSDNGIGMDINTKKIKNGLKNMENRIRSINGVFTFDSEINKGVKVKIIFSI